MELLSTQEAKKRLGISDATMRRWIRAGKIEGQLINHMYYFREQDIAKLLTNRNKEDALSQRLSSMEAKIEKLDLELLKLREARTH